MNQSKQISDPDDSKNTLSAKVSQPKPQTVPDQPGKELGTAYRDVVIDPIQPRRDETDNWFPNAATKLYWIQNNCDALIKKSDPKSQNSPLSL